MTLPSFEELGTNLQQKSGWFREETQNDYFQPTIDMILNVSIFAWYGAICPWYMFVHNHGVLPIYRLIFLGILVMLFRRLPMVFLFQKQIPQMKTHRHLLFMGYFGPIGVSAIFYLYTSREFLRTITVGEGSQERTREDAEKLEEIILLVVWFLVMCSIVGFPVYLFLEMHNLLIFAEHRGNPLHKFLLDQCALAANETPN